MSTNNIDLDTVNSSYCSATISHNRSRWYYFITFIAAETPRLEAHKAITMADVKSWVKEDGVQSKVETCTVHVGPARQE